MATERHTGPPAPVIRSRRAPNTATLEAANKPTTDVMRRLVGERRAVALVLRPLAETITAICGMLLLLTAVAVVSGLRVPWWFTAAAFVGLGGDCLLWGLGMLTFRRPPFRVVAHGPPRSRRRRGRCAG
jgi:hypothetical protein